MKDVVYILKKGSRNSYSELRFSLRSLCNLEHRNVYLIGGKPDWIDNIIHIDAEDPYKIKVKNALHKITIACKDKRISENFILMNDDFYIMKPMKLKYYAKGTMIDQLKSYKARYNNSKYIRMMERTVKLFNYKGYDFGVHCPIVYNKKKFLDLFKYYDLEKGYLLRTLYCNHYKVKVEIINDNKITSVPKIYSLFDKEMDFLSTSDSIGSKMVFNRLMKSKFPEKCKYERIDNS